MINHHHQKSPRLNPSFANDNDSDDNEEEDDDDEDDDIHMNDLQNNRKIK